MTSNQINKAIAFLGLHVIRGRAYSYLHDAEGNQIGESVWVYRLNHLSLQQWVEQARQRWEEHHAARTPFPIETVRQMLTLTNSGPLALKYLETIHTRRLSCRQIKLQLIPCASREHEGINPSHIALAGMAHNRKL